VAAGWGPAQQLTNSGACVNYPWITFAKLKGSRTSRRRHVQRAIDLLIIASLHGLRSSDHGKLNLIGKGGQMHGEPFEQFSLRWGRGEVADQSAFGRVRAELFQLLSIVQHGAPPYPTFW
jgi:hypothetical protein